MTVLYLSWSQLRYHSECRQQAHLLREKGKPPDANIRAYFPGTVCDRTMRSWLEDEGREPGGMVTHPEYGVAATLIREEARARDNGDGIVKWKSVRDRREVAELCATAVDRLEPVLRERVLHLDFQPAARFKVPVQIPDKAGQSVTIVLVGEMDLLCRVKGEEQATQPWQIWDLKITKDNSYWRKTISQLVFYDIATFAMFGQYTHRAGLFQPLCKDQTPNFEITNQQRVEMMQRIIGMAHKIWDKDFDLAEDTKPCFMCMVKNSCPRFKPVGGKLTIGPISQDIESLLELT